jgi:hypothetical protein
MHWQRDHEATEAIVAAVIGHESFSSDLPVDPNKRSYFGGGCPALPST